MPLSSDHHADSIAAVAAAAAGEDALTLGTDDPDDISHEQVVWFIEAPEVFDLITVLSSRDLSEVSRVLQRLRFIFDRYLECPTLLDPSLESLVTKLTAPLLELFHAWEGIPMVAARKEQEEHSHDVEIDAVRFIESIRYHSSVIYYLCKVRGRKYVQRFLPHDVCDVTPVWRTLQTILLFQENASEASLTSHLDSSAWSEASVAKPEEIAPLWETTYVLWIWMSTLSLVPFDTSTFATAATTTATTATAASSICTELTFTAQVIDTGQRHLHRSGPIRAVVSMCLSSWLSRPDHIHPSQPQQQRQDAPFQSFLMHARTVIESFLIDNHNHSSSEQCRVLGYLETITTMLKRSAIPRDDVLPHLLPLWNPIRQLSDGSNDTLLQKLLVKWWTRVSCTILPPRLASWRYQRGKRLLFQCQPDNTRNTTTELGEGIIPADVDDDWIVPDEVEYAMGRIIQELSNASTIVRWSAAKGVGRVTERLPSLCADDVLDAILLLFRDADQDRCWHGACLALAELARRGLLLPQRLPDVIPFLVQAVHYDRRRGFITVGAHVRDAACYTYWAFTRAYDPRILQPFISDMTRAIILTSLFDREVNCRRSASSAFQEAVGRQGATNFPHGIEILTAADYFSLGNRVNAYLTIAIQIAKFDKLRTPIIQHLYESKLYHWDINLRKLSSKALHKLTPLDPKYMCDVVIPILLKNCLDEQDLFTRHGAVLGVAEIVMSLSANDSLMYLPNNIEELLTDLVPTIERKRLYRGRGGEVMRLAVCRLIECISLSRIPLSVKGQVRLLDSIESNIPHPTQGIQEDACRALEALMTSYFPVGAGGPSPRLQQRVVNKFIETIQSTVNPAVARGYALALGHLPEKLVCPTMEVLQSILDRLARTSHHNALIGGESDAETRKNSLRSLARISRLIFIPSGDKCRNNETTLVPVVRMDKYIFDRLCKSFLAAMDDYRSDRRGDVGSWCRLVGMESITDLLLAVASDDGIKPKWMVDDELTTTTIGVILKQLAEKLDNVRHRAGACLQQLVASPHLVDIVASHSDLVLALNQFQSIVPRKDDPWIDPAQTFALLMNVISCTNNNVYFECIITGIVSSIGGLSEDVYKYSSSALLHFMKRSTSDKREQLIMFLLKLFQERNNRLVQPILKTLDLLLTHGYCSDVIIHQAKLTQNCFTEHLILCMQHEATISTNVARLLQVADVSVSLLTALLSCSEFSSFDNGETKRILTLLCSMLSHPFPRVRSYVADQMYTYLMVNDTDIENHIGYDNMASNGHRAKIDMTIPELLLHTLWSNDVDDVMVVLQPVTIQIANGLGIEVELSQFQRRPQSQPPATPRHAPGCVS